MYTMLQQLHHSSVSNGDSWDSLASPDSLSKPKQNTPEKRPKQLGIRHDWERLDYRR